MKDFQPPPPPLKLSSMKTLMFTAMARHESKQKKSMFSFIDYVFLNKDYRFMFLSKLHLSLLTNLGEEKKSQDSGGWGEEEDESR